ncbi:hypothetical protein Kfla_2616 [Kribbella flavida DSM 17836]|uniref:Uncharacterized protein n=1 Tax=Kribbella flavida (strain DSM 17836 / JCM 10339 / NBRC 14399) TaxID=479435 RepID=D2PXP2_KRIFD|nr:hypothetical protein [Kribbella flavida]ADB31684.1 hypothetical protein Kfla_2616 [Kribbella flavida DSM 17836]
MNLSLADQATLPDLSDQERHLLNLVATPAATLLGLVADALRTRLFGDDPVTWVDGWQTNPSTARLEWQDGPEVAEVVEHLAARLVEDTVEGVPGLRAVTTTDTHAQLVWLGGTTPVALHLTRLDG